MVKIISTSTFPKVPLNVTHTSMALSNFLHNYIFYIIVFKWFAHQQNVLIILTVSERESEWGRINFCWNNLESPINGEQFSFNVFPISGNISQPLETERQTKLTGWKLLCIHSFSPPLRLTWIFFYYLSFLSLTIINFSPQPRPSKVSQS